MGLRRPSKDTHTQKDIRVSPNWIINASDNDILKGISEVVIKTISLSKYLSKERTWENTNGSYTTT